MLLLGNLQKLSPFNQRFPSICVSSNTRTFIKGFQVFPWDFPDFRNAEIFPEAYVTYEPTYAYLSLFMGSWNIQEYLDSNLFKLHR